MLGCPVIALLDDACEVAVLRGAPVEHPKYRGRRVFGAGINLTHLYHGRIPYLWYLRRDLGYVNKIYRGLAMADDAAPDEFGGGVAQKKGRSKGAAKFREETPRKGGGFAILRSQYRAAAI